MTTRRTRRLRAGQADPNFTNSISKARGKVPTTCFRGTRKLVARNAGRAAPLIDDLFVRDLSKS